MDHTPLNGPRKGKREHNIAVTPASVSQRTVLAVTGLTPAKYLEIVPAWGIPATRVGQLLIVETSVLLRFIREHSDDIERPTEELTPADGEARIEKMLGLRRVV